MSERTNKKEILRSAFRGALLGTMVGDALGMPVEGMSAQQIRKQYGRVDRMLPARLGAGTYTDDTQMTLALAEALVQDRGQMNLDSVAGCFARAFDDRRGYGGNARRILAKIKAGDPWTEVVEVLSLPGGSYANGGAMRVCPVSLIFYGGLDKVLAAAMEQCRVTGHTHPNAVSGAVLAAHAVHEALRCHVEGRSFDIGAFVTKAGEYVTGDFHGPLEWILHHTETSVQRACRNLEPSSRASGSVPAALWAFFHRMDDAAEAVITAVNLGGDTDTIGAMTGAMAGAYHGDGAFPEEWTDVLENGDKGRDYLLNLADQLADLVFQTH